ncbi:glycoside hydrolase family 3 N-terminal domain-containing protein [Nonlabens sp. YIK11]|uniref:glycoside hydrolase family 3 N-terminal domain-containing protein n=1 Tax=Nonlabens sp. YIK11 TaxID=1453349 RepID=UPI0006DC026B|nr:glycoside hydrolase family 3 N-terminal domain-containing protein [Nonlabens sp. YIK11]
MSHCKLYIFILIALVCNFSKSQTVTYSNAEIRSLIEKMTIEEKVGQMAQITLDVITKGKNEMESDEPLELDPALVKKAIVDYKIGSVLNTANNRARTRDKWHEVIGQLQQVAKEDTRLKIPILYGIDAIHGTTYTAGATFFPQQIGLAATWNPEIAKTAAEITAYETRASGIPWNFSPVLDLGRDPRFPRIWESFGEDPYLASVFGEKMVMGYEGNKSSTAIDKFHVSSCLKHFLGYSVPTNGKDRTPAIISNIQLEELHIPPFQRAIEAGASSIMINSGIINGVPVHANKELLTGLLKERLNFKGLVVTDWKDIENLHERDKVAATMKEAVMMSVNAGVDMSMIPYNFDFCKHLVELVNEGKVDMSRIDDAVERILNLKNKLGLFDVSLFAKAEYPKFASTEFQEMAYQASLESITLLKNENAILPLSKSKKVLVAGPNSNSMRTLNGGWSYSWQGEKVEEFAQGYNTILEAITNQLGADNVIHKEGVSYDHEGKYWEEKDIDINAAVEASQTVDVIILCLGENSYTEKPGDLHDLEISQNQIDLAKALAKTGKPMVLVLNEGRPRLIGEIEPHMSAIIQTYLPGNYGADALATLLYGEANFSGKLPYTYPLYSNSLVNYNYKPSESQNKMDGVYDYESDFAIQYPFGYGLSYTTFDYSDLRTDKNDYDVDDEIKVSVKVTNTGNRVGKEVVQLYTSDLYASITPDTKRLKRFKKVEIKPGESQRVEFILKAEDLAFVNQNLQWTVEQGDFEIVISDHSKTINLSKTETITN